MQYAVVAAALVAAVAADGWEVYTTPVTTPAPVYTTTTKAPVYTTPVSVAEWSEWASAPASSTWEAVSSIPVESTTKKPTATTSWAVWTTSAVKTSAIPTYTGAANKVNMAGAGAMGLAAVAFML